MSTHTRITLAGIALAGLALCLASPSFAQDPSPPMTETAPIGPEESAKFVNEIPEDTEKVTTESGLVYSVLRPGTGDVKPAMGDAVTVHYTGWTTDGRVFDSSRKRGQPAQFNVGGLIPGWNEALQLMTTGARLKLTIPADLAYGKDGSPPVIPPNATLIFDMELIDVRPVPKFVAPNPENQTTTESGLKYEVLAAGEGEIATAEHAVEFAYTLFNTKGNLLESTSQHGRKISGTTETMPVKFMGEAMLLMKPGTKMRFEVPPALAFGERAVHPTLLPANSVTIWELEATRIVELTPVPEFSMPAAEDLKTTASGLQYQVVREGNPDGKKPKMGEFVTVHYAGWLTDGDLFDSSYGRGFPTSFQLGRVIAGWNEGLQLMTPGSVYKFVIPGNLAYGPRGSGEKIGPNATLVFLVEYLKAGQE